MKHNKKRNPGVLYNILIQEITKSMLDKNHAKAKKLLSLIKTSFSAKTEIGKELKIYESLISLRKEKNENLERFLTEYKIEHSHINQKKLTSEKGKLISRINRTFGKQIWKNYIKDYKELATVYQIFNANAKQRVLMEMQFLEGKKEELDVTIDSLGEDGKIIFSKFFKKFNEKYSTSLLREQKVVLSSYILESPQSVEFKMILNEEIGELKEKVLKMAEKSKSERKESLFQLLEHLNEFAKKEIDDSMIISVLKVRSLVESE